MTWFANAANESEATKVHSFPIFAVDFDMPSGHERFWTGIGTINILGDDYIGTGDLAQIKSESETTELNAQRYTFTLSGIDPTLVPESDIDNSFGRSVTLYLIFLDPETRALIASPETMWNGRIDSISRTRGANPVIEINAEHIFAWLDRVDGWRYTHEHQQQFFAGDNGLDQVNAIALKKVTWSGNNVDPAVRNPDWQPPIPRRPLP